MAAIADLVPGDVAIGIGSALDLLATAKVRIALLARAGAISIGRTAWKADAVAGLTDPVDAAISIGTTGSNANSRVSAAVIAVGAIRAGGAWLAGGRRQSAWRAPSDQGDEAAADPRR